MYVVTIVKICLCLEPGFVWLVVRDHILWGAWTLRKHRSDSKCLVRVMRRRCCKAQSCLEGRMHIWLGCIILIYLIYVYIIRDIYVQIIDIYIYIYNMQSSSFQLLRIVPIDLDRSQSLKDDVRCLCQNLADLQIEVFGPSSMQSVGESNDWLETGGDREKRCQGVDSWPKWWIGSWKWNEETLWFSGLGNLG